MEDKLDAGGVSIFYLANDTDNNGHDRGIENYLKIFDVNAIDGFKYDDIEQTITSKRGKVPCPVTKYMKDAKNVAENESNTTYPEQHNMNSYNGFDEFVSYLASQEVEGLDIMDDNTKIMENIKLGYQYAWQESFGIIAYKVMSVSELFKGALNASIVDRKVFTKEILSKEDAAKIAVFHNHPSGVPKPSREDLQVTEGLTKIAEKLDMQLLDHYIVGKNDVYSITDRMPEYVSDNTNYRDSVKGLNNPGDKQFELDI